MCICDILTSWLAAIKANFSTLSALVTQQHQQQDIHHDIVHLHLLHPDGDPGQPPHKLWSLEPPGRSYIYICYNFFLEVRGSRGETAMIREAHEAFKERPKEASKVQKEP